jgi:uncharacterized membrane protein
MKHLHTVVVVLLNALFCTALLWFFTRNAYLRPYAGSATKEILAGLLLLGTIYTNYYVLYPILYNKYRVLYWVSVAGASLVTAAVELAICKTFIIEMNASFIAEDGPFAFFSKLLLFMFGRNLAFNFMPFIIRNMQHLKEEVETKVQVIYQQNRLLDVCDNKNNCQYIPIDNILYFRKRGNYMFVYTIEGTTFTRYCSIKHLGQLLGENEFVRISKSIIVPYQYIESYDEKQVFMKKMPCSEEALSFNFGSQIRDYALKLLAEHVQILPQEEISAEEPEEETESMQEKKPLSLPPQHKLDAVYAYIQSHPGSRSNEITSNIKFSQSTIERCLTELRKKSLIEYVGSKKTGGYRVVEKKDDNPDM